MATANAMIAALYAHLDAEIETEISPRWRRQGEPIPFIVYEVQSIEWVRHMTTFTKDAEVTVAFQCLAGTVGEAMSIADEIKSALAAKNTVSNVTFAATSLNYRVADAVPDDGTGDAERIVTVTATIYMQDEN